MPDETLGTMAINIALPEPQTMQKHLASANPHPQYITSADLSAAASANIRLRDLVDVSIDTTTELTSKVLYNSGGNWVPATVAEIVHIATPESPGIVKVATTTAEIRVAIENNQVTGLVEQVNPNMFLCCTGYSNGNLSRVIREEPTGNVGVIDDLSNVVYDVYSRGVLSGYSNVSSATAVINVHSGGIAYDTSTCGHVSVFQNAEMKRVKLTMPAAVSNANNVNYTGDFWDSAAKLVVAGDVRNVDCAATGWLASGADRQAKCNIYVCSHGHLRNATIEKAAHLYCMDGVVERITVKDTASSTDHPNFYGMIVTPSGSAYEVTLQGSYARASIQGYAQDVCVYSGCQLDVQYSTAKIKNLTLYNGARLAMDSGASVDGLVAYPGAIIMKASDCVITKSAACHEPDKTTILLDSATNVYTKAIISGSTVVQVNTTFVKHGGETITNLNYGEALLFESAAIVNSSGTVSSSYVGGPEVLVYATDAPRGLVRVDTDLVTSLDSGLVPLNSRAEAISSAYQYQDANLISCIKADELLPATYTLSAPEGMYTDLHDSANTIKWKIIF